MANGPVEVFAGINSTSGTSFTGTLTSSVAIGDLLVVVVQCDSTDAVNTGTIVTDSADGVSFGSNTYSFAQDTAQNSATRAAVWYTVATSALTSGTSKIRFTTGGSNKKTLHAFKFTGVSTVSLDKIAKSASQASTTSPVSGTTAATTQAVEAVIAFYLYAGAPSFTAPAGYSQLTTTQQTTNGSVCSVSTVYKFVAATGTQAGTATLGSAATAGGGIATFKYTDVSGSPPSNSVAPAVTGNKWTGQTLTSTAGTWTDNGSGVKTYQWQHADDLGFTTNVANATNTSTNSTYVLATGEATKYMRCTVTDTDSNGATSANSNIVGPIGPAYAPTLNSGKIDVCANASLASFTPGDTPIVSVLRRDQSFEELALLMQLV